MGIASQFRLFVRSKLYPANVLLPIISICQVDVVGELTLISGNVSSVKTSNLAVIPGAMFSSPGLTREPYLRYRDGNNAISAMARLIS